MRNIFKEFANRLKKGDFYLPLRNYIQIFFVVFEFFNSCVYYQFHPITNQMILIFFSILAVYLFINDCIHNNLLLKYRAYYLAGLILLLLVISYFYHIDFSVSKEKVIRHLLVQINWLLLLFFNPDIKDKNSLKYSNYTLDIIFSSIILLSFLVSSVSLILWIVLVVLKIDISQYTSLSVVSGGRLSALYFNANLAGITPLVSFYLSFYVITNNNKGKNDRSTFFIINAIIQLITIYLSKSRSVILVLVASTIIYSAYAICLKYKKVNRFKQQVLFIAFTITITVGALISKVRGQLNITKSDSIIQNIDHLTSSRFSLYREMIQIAIHSPILGSGDTTAPYYARKLLGKDALIYKVGYQSSHDLYIDAFYQTGILGLILLIAFTITLVKEILYRNTYISKQKYLLELFVFVSIFIYSLFNPMLLYTTEFPSPIFWALIGQVVIQNRYEKNCHNSEQ